MRPPSAVLGGRGARDRKRGGRRTHAFNPFHVVRLGQRAVDQVRRDEWNAHDRSNTRAGKLIKGTRWSVLKSPKKQTIDQLAKLGEVQQGNRALYRAFLLKEELRLLYHLDDPCLALEHLRRLAQLGIPLPARAVRQARPHDPPLPDRDPHGDPTRARQRPNRSLNSRIRLISHRSFGFHTPAPLIALIYLCCAGMHVRLPR